VSSPESAGLASASVAFIGAGKMGSALLAGLLRGERPGRVLVVEPNASAEAQALCKEGGFQLCANVPSDAAPVDALVLAIKPQMLEDAAPALKPLIGPDTLVVSILAGKRVADLAARLPARAFVRSMPNTPAAIGRGVTGAFANAPTSEARRALAQSLLGAAGAVEWVEREELIDAVTAVSGSGPAYVFYLAECLAAAGVAAGLPKDLSMRLARATVSGAGELMHRSPETEPGKLRENVTSPGGTTAAALGVLMAEDGLKPLLERAVAAAQRRAEELSG
jgi:pyrroline-5-carboxylate reductase